MAQEFDVVILGGGPGGYAAALYGAAAGLSIGMIEEARVGGTCLHRGCIPAKELLQTAEVLRTVAGAKEFGVEAGQPVLDLSVSQQRKQQVIDRLTKGLESVLKGRKVTTFNGPGHGGRRRRPHAAGRSTRRHRDHRHQGARAWPPARAPAAFPASTSTASGS